MPNPLNRRAFLGRTGTIAALAVANPPLWGRPETSSARPLRLGGPIFLKSTDPADLAQEHRRLGYRAAYAPQVEINDTDRIRAIIKEFAARDVALAEVGAWRNMLDVDLEKRRQNLAYVQERLALAEMLGTRCCVDIAGSFNPLHWDGPDPKNITEEFIDATVENCRHVIDAVKPARTKFTIEMMPFNFPTGPDDYLKLIKKVDRKAFAVHLDACNVMNCPERMYNNGAVIDECFKKLGPWIVSCHAKDLSWEDYVQVSLREVIPGRGQLDYRAYLRGLSGLPVDAPLMLEHLKTAEEYDEGRHYIQKVAREMGLSFGAEGA
ncbi:MAG: sugar phosphate isomerase/epimerase family protein [Terriglobia bacterium]